MFVTILDVVIAGLVMGGIYALIAWGSACSMELPEC